MNVISNITSSINQVQRTKYKEPSTKNQVQRIKYKESSTKNQVQRRRGGGEHK